MISCSYASVNSSGAHPPPPRGQPPGISIFFLKMANSRGWGQVSPSNAPGWDQNRRQMPHPRDHLESNTAQDFNNKS